MSDYSILPPHETGFWLKKWFGGVIGSSTLLICGVLSVVSRHSYVLTRAAGYRRVTFIEVHEALAVIIGVGYIGAALALFSYCYAPYHERLYGASDCGLAAGLLLAAAAQFTSHGRFPLVVFYDDSRRSNGIPRLRSG